MLAAIEITRRQGGRKRCFQSPRYNRTIMALRGFKRTTAAASTNKSPLSKCLRQKQENQHERFGRLPSHNHQESHSLHRGRSSASTPMSGIRYDTAEEHHHRILIDPQSCQFRITLPASMSQPTFRPCRDQPWRCCLPLPFPPVLPFVQPSEIQDEYWNNVVLGTLGNTLEPDMITGLRLVERGLGEAAGACLAIYCHGQFFRICSTSKPHGLNSQTC